jgi:Fe-S-cluster containining protein
MSAAVTACRACEGRCCTTYIVPLNGYDVWRIVQQQLLAPALFVRREPEEHSSDAGFLLRPGGLTYGLALQHHAARRNARPCVFLLQLRDGVQRCGIYDQRPLACQTYPMQWRQEQAAPRADLLCPPGSWQGLESEQAGWRERLLRQDQEWRRYAPVVQAWNAVVQAQPAECGYVLAQYLEYLLQAYDLLAQHPDEPAIERELMALAEAYMYL